MGRQVNPEKAEYMKAVNVNMADLFGVGFSEVYKDIDPELSLMSRALESGTFANAWAEQIGASFGFVKVGGDVTFEDARARNVRSAALVTLARDEAGWSVGGDGAIYKEADDGVLKIEAVAVKSGVSKAWGFKADYASGAVIEIDNGRVKISSGEFERLGSGIDISDAIAKYENRLEASQGIGLR